MKSTEGLAEIMTDKEQVEFLKKNPGYVKQLILRTHGQGQSSSRLMPLAAQVAKEKLGIDKIQTFIEVVGGGLEDYFEAKQENSPGGTKVTFFEGLGLAMKRIPGVIDVGINIKELGLQFMDLDEDEKQEVIEHYQEKFNIPNKELAELRCEIAFKVGVNIAYEIKWGVQSWKEAGEVYAAIAAADSEVADSQEPSKVNPE